VNKNPSSILPSVDTMFSIIIRQKLLAAKKRQKIKAKGKES
jgi:hypothetical protein